MFLQKGPPETFRKGLVKTVIFETPVPGMFGFPGRSAQLRHCAAAPVKNEQP